MTKRARFGPSLLLALAASFLLPPPLTADDLNWQTDWDAAFALAAAEQKPVFINFFAEWCGPCRQMRRTTLRDPRVLEQLDRFVLLKVDVTKRKSGEKYGVRALPWYSIRDPWEQEVLAFVGYHEARYFAPRLASVADATPEIVNAAVQLKEGAAVDGYRAHAAIAQRAGAEQSARVAYRKAADAAAADGLADLSSIMRIEAALTLIRGNKLLVRDGIRELEAIVETSQSSEVLAATWLAIGYAEEQRRKPAAARKAYERGLALAGETSSLGKQLAGKLEALGKR